MVPHICICLSWLLGDVMLTEEYVLSFNHTKTGNRYLFTDKPRRDVEALASLVHSGCLPITHSYRYRLECPYCGSEFMNREEPPCCDTSGWQWFDYQCGMEVAYVYVDSGRAFPTAICALVGITNRTELCRHAAAIQDDII